MLPHVGNNFLKNSLTVEVKGLLYCNHTNLGASLSQWCFGLSVLACSLASCCHKSTEVPWSPVALSCWHFCICYIASVPSSCLQQGDGSRWGDGEIAFPITSLRSCCPVPRLCAPERTSIHLEKMSSSFFLWKPLFLLWGWREHHCGSARVTCPVATGPMSFYNSCPILYQEASATETTGKGEATGHGVLSLPAVSWEFSCDLT